VSLIPSQVKGFINELSDLLSADDADFQTPGVVADPIRHEAAADPLAGRPNIAYMSLATADAAPAAGAGFLASTKQTLSNAATSVSSAVSSLVSKVTGGTSSDPAAKSASSAGGSSSSWMLWALLAGGAAAVYFAMKPKGKGGKSFLSKLGGKSSVKL
jgi:hypothetical protein